MKRKLITFFLLALIPVGVNLTSAQQNEAINISPIVQIISYKNIYWKYVQMLGWWSASIINTWWVIVTNNHVVDDGKWNVADVFNICITKKIKEKPSCDYTATLIDRDENKDIAILKIDNKDINGIDVNYNNFQNIEVDFEYTPKTQDEVIAIGYPWIWADTITETKWIISWISKYNDNSYIKTDTIIAGGNSWWGLVRNWKLIWVPTFWIGGFYDPSLWYALSIAEAKDFILSNINKIPESKASFFDFRWYKSTIDKINSSWKVEDKIFDVKVTNDYEIMNYIPNKKLEIKPRQQKEIIIQWMNISLENIPNITTEKDFYYFLESRWFYYRQGQKLKKVTIWWITFYNPVFLDDKSWWQTDYYKSYIAKISNNKVIKIDAVMGSVEEKNSQKMQDQLQKLLSNVNFKKDFESVNFDFSLNSPKLSVKTETWTSSNDIQWTFYKYFWNLHEFFNISVSLKDLYSGKGQSYEEIYKAETTNVSDDLKAKFNYKWLKGYMYCQEMTNVYTISVDEKWNPLNQSQCNISIVEWLKGMNNEEYELDITLISDKNNIEKNLDNTINFLNQNIQIDNITWDTTLSNILKNQVKLLYSDISYQPKGFKNKLKLLVKYWIIDNGNKFDANKPLKREEFLYMYLKGIYWMRLSQVNWCLATSYKCIFNNYKLDINWEQITIKQLVDQLGINLDSYVNADTTPVNKLEDFATFIDMKLSWVTKSDIWENSFSEEFFNNYAYLKEEEVFQNITNKMKEFYFKTFGNRKIGVWETWLPVSNSIPSVEVKFVNWKWIKVKPTYKNTPYNFEYQKDPEAIKLDQEYKKCMSSKNNKQLTACLKKLDESFKEEGFLVLTKANAVDFIVDKMDFGLFDSNLAKKKDTMIEWWENTEENK